ncbi:nucleoside 2-deoxyribosyltransferase domain-containing protein [Paracrocinitomix mangrovi]|uniref:nucleoside 2-deoxyribosyltransferase domain-containing protein n=1 Tax=Paracrocinitomix mangrovi TaxID=2862509 RepID=UPI001C8E68C6|nr:nucleoside 2-deoxyribosyltransferase domain-containing protein [Paracrocinitomix mangrovi]UKN00770.1 nucleoside 2-deoxyribosyltransferase domain-containing protein [Paracrocinitomix mangrovi]
MPIFKSPQNIDLRDQSLPSVFLAGSIEMDKAIDWQAECEKQLTNYWNVFNPRRESWDASWKQVKENPQFNEQVNWELNALETADQIIMYFAPHTKSPISLLEFGLYAKSGKMSVVCDTEFWRKGNIDIVCERYQVQQYQTIEELLNELITKKSSD